jgi:hypothetical protein
VGVDGKPKLACKSVYVLVENVLEIVIKLHVLDRSAVGADKMVMMRAEIFGELISSKLVSADYATQDACFFEHRKVAIHTRLGQVGIARKQIGDGLWVTSSNQHIHELSSTIRVTLAVCSDTLRRDEVYVRMVQLGHGSSLPYRSIKSLSWPWQHGYGYCSWGFLPKRLSNKPAG